jgi:hypothetical protein
MVRESGRQSPLTSIRDFNVAHHENLDACGCPAFQATEIRKEERNEVYDVRNV